MKTIAINSIKRGKPSEVETPCRKAGYRVHGCIDHGDHIEGLVENDRAELWGVYKVLADDTEEWVADFKSHGDAQMFALAKGKEAPLRAGRLALLTVPGNPCCRLDLQPVILRQEQGFG